MYKYISKVLAISLISFLTFSFCFTKPAEAAKFVTGDYTLNREEILHEDLFVSGNTVVINGIVDGDVYIAADNISITGTISEDVYVAAETVNLTGSVYGDLVSFGSTVNVIGSVGKSAYLIGGNVSSTGSVVDDLIAIGGVVNTEGYVDEDLIALGGDITVSSTVKEDLIAFGAGLSLSDATVSGKTYKEEGNFQTEDFNFVFNPDVSWSTILSTTLITAVSTYLIGTLLIYLMPVKTLNIVKLSTNTGEDFIKSFATGFVILFIASAPLLLLLSFTIIGIPLAGILFTLLTFLVLYARLWVEIGIGKLVLTSIGEKKFSFYTALLIGRCVSILINLIPIVGTIYTMVITLVGLGAFFRMKYDLITPSKKKITNTKSKSKKK